MEFTRSGLVDLFSKLDTGPKYKMLVEDAQGRFNLRVSEKGCEFNTNFPFFRTEYFFESKFLIFEVANSLHDLLQRPKWDKNIQQNIALKE